MNYLFSSASLRILESLSFTETLYGFDFDGTLAPIVKNPDAARMSRETESLFSRLSSRVATAVITGRSLDDLRSRVPGTVKYLVGNHGLEGMPHAGQSTAQDLKDACRDWKNALQEKLEQEIRDPGIVLEDKGYSLALHYRNSRQKKQARTQLLRALESLGGNPKLVPGKLVFNVLPAGGPHKGMALSAVMVREGARFGFFIGDDYTDEDVFSMSNHRLLTVNVGERKNSQAQYFIRRQTEINRLLRCLLKFHGVQE